MFVTVVHNILMVLEPERHADDDELERYSLGGVATDERARLEEHLLICAACRERLEDQALFADAMAGAAGRWRAEHAAKKKRSWWFPRLALAAGLLILLITLALWVNRSGLPQTAAPVAIALSTTRGVAAAAHAPAMRPLELRPDFAGLASFPQYDLEVVDRTGVRVARAKASVDAPVAIHGLHPGAYFVRVYSPAGELLREYALVVSD